MAWRDLSRREKILAAVAIALVVWEGVGTTVQVAYALSAGQNPLNSSPLCFLVGTNQTAANVCPSTGGSGNSGVTTQASTLPAFWNCLLSASNFAGCVWNSIQGNLGQLWNSLLPYLNPILQPIYAFDQAITAAYLQVVQWIGSINAQLTSIWNYIASLPALVQSWVSAFLSTVVAAVSDAVSGTISAIVNAAQAAVNEAINILGYPFQVAENFANSVAQSWGPLAPVVVMIVVGGMVIAAIALTWVFVRVMWGVGKSIYNLL